MSNDGSSRKAAQRERDKSSGVKRLEIRLSHGVAEVLEELCRIRGGSLGPYSLAEFVEVLIEQDAERLSVQMEQIKASGPCPNCKRELPNGCGGSFRGESGCFHSLDYRMLLLREPVRLTINELRKY